MNQAKNKSTVYIWLPWSTSCWGISSASYPHPQKGENSIELSLSHPHFSILGPPGRNSTCCSFCFCSLTCLRSEGIYRQWLRSRSEQIWLCHTGQCIMHPMCKEKLPRNALNSQRADYKIQTGAGGQMLWRRRVRRIEEEEEEESGDRILFFSCSFLFCS